MRPYWLFLVLEIQRKYLTKILGLNFFFQYAVSTLKYSLIGNDFRNNYKVLKYLCYVEGGWVLFKCVD